MAASAEQLAEARDLILGWLKFAEETDRRRSPKEAPPHLTRRYLRLEAAWALSRVFPSTSIDDIAGPAFAELRAGREVEQVLAGCYVQRIAEATAQTAPGEWPPHDVNARIDSLGAFERYRIERLLSASYTLSPSRDPDAIFRYWHDATNGGDAWQLRPLGNAHRSLDDLVQTIAQVIPQQWKTVAHDVVAVGASGLPAANALLGAAKKKWPGVTDSFNTNEYYCWSMIALFGTITFTIAQAVNPIDLGAPTS